MLDSILLGIGLGVAVVIVGEGLAAVIRFLVDKYQAYKLKREVAAIPLWKDKNK